MKHFFECLERENDYQREYEKLEWLCNRRWEGFYGNANSLNSWISIRFFEWKKRGNYCSFDEVREQLDFSQKCPPKNIDLLNYCLFCEMIINIMQQLGLGSSYSEPGNTFNIFANTVKATIEKAGLEFRKNGEEIIIVEKNAVAIEVAEENPDLAETVIEYNHYLLRGNLKRKQELLKKISDALEPKRKHLNSICSKETRDFFYLINSMNIRHNNCDKSDSAKYNADFAEMSNREKEKWYDLIYEQGLYLFTSLAQQDRTECVKEYKTEIEKTI